MSESKLPRATAKGRDEIENTNVMIAGMKGSGKTTFVEEVLLPHKKRLIVVDTLAGEYGNPAFCKATGVKYDAVVEDFHEFLKLLASKASGGSFRIVARCPGHEREIFKLFAYDQTKKRSILTNTTLLVEEITFFMNSYEIDEALLSHLQYGRHNRNNLVGVTRSPYEVNPRFREQQDLIVSFVQSEERALKFFQQLNSAVASELRDLERGDYRLVKGQNDELLEFIKSE